MDRRLLVPGGPAELPRAIEAGDFLALQGGLQLQGVHAVILDGVGGAHHFRPLQAGDGVEHFQLHVLRQSGGEALDVQLLGVQAHGLDEQLVAFLVGEPVKAGDFGFNGRAVPGPYPLNHAAVHGGAVQVFPDDPVGFGVGVGQPADGPVHRAFLRLKGEGHRLRVPLLALHPGEIHRPGVDPGRRAGLEPPQGQPQL